MPIDVEFESLVELKKARYPGRDPHISTKYRHAFSGQLETIKIGGRLYTSREALLRFVARCNAPDRQALAPELSARRRAEMEAANRKLDAIGIRTQSPGATRASARNFECAENQRAV